MIGWLLDTNIISELNKRSCARAVEEWFAAQPEERLFLSVLTFGEFDKGIFLLDAADPERARLVAIRDAFEARFAPNILPVSRSVLSRWGEITARLKRKTGHPSSVIDTMLAATALEHDLYFVTRNVRHVERSGAVVFNPWADNPADSPLTR